MMIRYENGRPRSPGELMTPEKVEASLLIGALDGARQLHARADVELAEHVADVRLHGLRVLRKSSRAISGLVLRSTIRCATWGTTARERLER